MKFPWPSLARSCYGSHDRYTNTYFKGAEGSDDGFFAGYYFTGDGARRDADGYYWVTGRVDDVLNVSGHRLGTAEIESAIVEHPACVEAACVGIPHEIKGQVVFAYCILGQGEKDSPQLRNELRDKVKEVIGSFAKPQHVLVVPGVP